MAPDNRRETENRLAVLSHSVKARTCRGPMLDVGAARALNLTVTTPFPLNSIEE